MTWCRSLISCGWRWLPTWPLHGHIPLPHRIGPALLPGLVRRTRPGPAVCPAAAPRVVHPVDAGDPQVQPSTVSRRFSVAAGLYRTCVIDGLLEHSPAEHVRRPSVPPESPTLGFTHLQFEALLTAARE